MSVLRVENAKEKPKDSIAHSDIAIKLSCENKLCC